MDVHLINQKLKDLYGTDFLDQPIFRVVWSNDQLEKRLADFTDYIEGTNVFIRQVREVREVKKYTFIDSQYVLEKLFLNRHNNEILDNNTLSPRSCTYEPLWTFGREKDKPRKPVWRAIELLIRWHLNPKVLSPSEMADADINQLIEDERIMTELLNQHVPNDSLHAAIADGGAVILDSTKRFEFSGDKNGGN